MGKILGQKKSLILYKIINKSWSNASHTAFRSVPYNVIASKILEISNLFLFAVHKKRMKGNFYVISKRQEVKKSHKNKKRVRDESERENVCMCARTRNSKS